MNLFTYIWLTGKAIKQKRDAVNERLPSFLEIGWLTLRVKSPRGKQFVERVAQHRAWKWWFNLGVVTTSLISVLMTAVIVLSAWLVMQTKPDPSAMNKPSNMVVAPGVNDMIPIEITAHVAIALVLGATLHELGHAISARSDGIDVKEMGAIFLGPLPMGAYVKPDADDVEGASPMSRLRMFSAGIMSNVLLTVVTTPILLSGYTASLSSINDAYATALMSGGDVSGILALGSLTNFVFWMWFLNLNFALVNALPIATLDGGHIVKTYAEGMVEKIGWGRGVGSVALYGSSVFTLGAFLVAAFGPYVIGGR